MALHILVIGNRINLMDKENIFTATDIMKENLNKIKEKEPDLIFSIVEINTKASGIKINTMGSANLQIKMIL